MASVISRRVITPSAVRLIVPSSPVSPPRRMHATTSSSAITQKGGGPLYTADYGALEHRRDLVRHIRPKHGGDSKHQLPQLGCASRVSGRSVSTSRLCQLWVKISLLRRGARNKAVLSA